MRGSSDPSGALLLGIVGGLWSFFKGFRILREYKVLEDTPRIPVRSIAMGFVHIRGQAESENTLASPVSHTPCCFYKVEIDEWKSSGRSKSWQHCCTDADGYRFYLADETGKVLIDAHDAEYDLPVSSTRVVSSQETSAVGASGGASDRDLLQYVSYAQMHHMTERVGHWIDKGFERASLKANLKADLKESPAENPQLQARKEALHDLFAAIPAASKTGELPISLMAKLGAAGAPLKDPEKEQRRQMFLSRLQQIDTLRQSGQFPAINMSAIQAASGRYRLREYVILPGQEYLVSGTCIDDPSCAPDQERNVIAKGRNEPTFIISAKSDQALNRDLRRRAALMIVGGAAVALACLAGLLVHFHMF
jgi:E3 Ubiquitin ligase